METLSRLVIRYRWILLPAMLIATVGFAYQTRRLTSDYDYEAWLPDGDEVAELIRQVDAEFSATMVLFAILDFGERGVFHPESLGLVQRITGALEGTEGLFDVTSLLNVIDIRRIEDGISVGNLIREIPRTDGEMKALEAYVLGREQYVNTVVSANGRFTVLIVRLASAYDELKVAHTVMERVKALAGDQPCYFGGDPAVAQAISEYSNRDFRNLVPAMVALMILVLGFGLRRVLGVILPLSFVLICLAWTFGLKAILGYPLNMLSPCLAVMLIAIGSDYAVHIYNHFLRRRDIVLAMSEITLPVAMSALTTVMGLLTFAVTGIPNLTYFGIEMAIGLSSACLVSLILLPICIHLFRAKPGPPEMDNLEKEHIYYRVLFALGARVHRHAVLIVVVSGILMAIMGVGVARISTNVDFVELLPKGSSPRRGNAILEEHFGGMYANTIYFQGDLSDPDVLARQLYLENFLRSDPLLSSFNSLNGYIAEENWLFSGAYAVPESRAGVANLWLLLENEEMMDMIVSPGRDTGLVTSFIRESATGELKGVSRRIRAFLDREVSDTVVRVDPERLTPDGAESLAHLRLREAARQLAWLATHYDGEERPDPAPLYDRLQEVFPAAAGATGFPAVTAGMRRYLEEEALEVLPADLVDALVVQASDHREEWTAAAFRSDLAGRMTDSGAVDAETAALIVEGMLARAEGSRRLERAGLLWQSLRTLLPATAGKDKHLEKRARGVLWTLLSPYPVFFAKQVEDVPEIQRGVIDVQEVRIRQAGFPEIIARLEGVLFDSQYVSLALASLAVFVLVSVTQLSVRRGLASLLSVLVPLEFVLGMMGWFGIPLDFGTVLNGALIVGLGIDGSIHFLHAYHRLRREGTDRRLALQVTMGHVGTAVLTANATTSAGFLILLFGHTSAVRNFAFTAGMAIVLVTISILTFLPALIVLLGLDRKSAGPPGLPSPQPVERT